VNLDRTATALKKDFDIIGLNEVRNSPPLSNNPDQALILGQKLSMQALFAPTEKKWWRDDFGNGMLSSISVVQWKRIPLAGSTGRGKRNLLHATVIVQGQPVQVLMTHIDRGNDRDAQLEYVFKHFLSVPQPAVLMGDFNATANEPVMEAILLFDAGMEAPLHTILGEKVPSGNIDWILTRGLQAVAAGIDTNDASDHPLVWAELKLKLPPTPPKKPD
jgi:endonuclease/exonuclease/phosphatase family metal-dependent hydrolase